MTPHDKKPTVDNDRTGEELAPEFDGTSTDQLDGTYRLRVVSASEGDIGGIDRDERGQARYKWRTDGAQSADPAAETFDYLKALDANLELEISQRVQVLEQAANVGNPYDTARPKKPK